MHFHYSDALWSQPPFPARTRVIPDPTRVIRARVRSRERAETSVRDDAGTICTLPANPTWDRAARERRGVVRGAIAVVRREITAGDRGRFNIGIARFSAVARRVIHSPKMFEGLGGRRVYPACLNF